MLDVESVTEEVIKRLGIYLEANMPSLAGVVREFPSANENLVFPSISISETGKSAFTPEQVPYIKAQGAIVDYKADVQYVVGNYELSLQLDMWCRNKEERNDMYQEFFKAFNSQFPIMGLSLNLTDYYNIICRYDLLSYNKEDSQVSSQTREWRVKMEVLVNCEALLEKEEFIMESLESYTEIPHGVEEVNSI